MKNKVRKARFAGIAIALTLAVSIFPVPSAAQGCKHWAEALAKSFFPRQVDEQGLHEFSTLSPQQYFSAISQDEEKSFQPESQASYSGQTRLNSALKQFYRVGLQVYGVRLNPDKLAVFPSADVNAFATGSLPRPGGSLPNNTAHFRVVFRGRTIGTAFTSSLHTKLRTT